MVLPQATIFIADAYVTLDPSPEEIADLTELAAATMRRMGVEPRAALVSHANFGDRPSASSRKMREAMEILRSRNPDFEVDGEMHADAALDPKLRSRAYAHSSLTGSANLLIMPNADTAHVALNLLKVLGSGIPVGPILMGAAKPAHIASQSVTVRGLLQPDRSRGGRVAGRSPGHAGGGGVTPFPVELLAGARTRTCPWRGTASRRFVGWSA